MFSLQSGREEREGAGRPQAFKGQRLSLEGAGEKKRILCGDLARLSFLFFLKMKSPIMRGFNGT